MKKPVSKVSICLLLMLYMRSSMKIRALGVALHLMEAGFRSDVEFVMPHDHSNAALTADERCE